MMVESMIALTIVVGGLLGIFTLTSRSVSLNQVITSQYVGSNLAAEGIEITKNIIDKNALQGRPWNEGIVSGDYEVDYLSRSLSAFSNRTLLLDPASGLYQYAVGNPTTYLRKITVDVISADEIAVKSLVSWTTRDSAQFEVNLEDHFFNWR